MQDPSPHDLYRDVVRPEWIDYNGHMNVAYYLLAFDGAADAFFDAIGINEAYRRTARSTTFAAECHITYQREVVAGDPLRFTVQIIGFDEKRIHFLQSMIHADQGYVAATSEWMSLHVDLDSRRVAPMPKAILDRLEKIHAVHQHLPRPPEVGRSIGLRRRV
ncbi:MAG: thioesterase family protein [Alphaproteobacteria bacterium]